MMYKNKQGEFIFKTARGKVDISKIAACSHLGSLLSRLLVRVPPLSLFSFGQGVLPHNCANKRGCKKSFEQAL